MDFVELCENRYSVRKFSDRQVEEEKINIILRSAQVSPTACNKQPQKIYALQSPEALEKCCRDAINFGKCNYSYVSNTVSTYHTETKPDAMDVSPENQEAVTGRYKDDDSQYSLKNLLMRQEKEAHHED